MAEAQDRLAVGAAGLDDSPVRIIFGAASLIMACWLIVSAKADEPVTDAMRRREIQESEAAGADLLGTQAKEWLAGPEWASSRPLRLGDLRGRVVVVRFWTDTCPYCEASLPAMQKLAEEMKDAPVTFVGLYQSKPLGSERPWKGVVAHAAKLGVTFPIAYDHHWATLRSWWLDGVRRRATSASFVIGPDGRFVHVHPGPVFFPSDDPADARANADFEAIREAIRRHLPQTPSRQKRK